MRKFACFIFIGLICICLVACTWPKVFVKSNSGWVTYDRFNHKLEVVWESIVETPQAPADSADVEKVVN